MTISSVVKELIRGIIIHDRGELMKTTFEAVEKTMQGSLVAEATAGRPIKTQRVARATVLLGVTDAGLGLLASSLHPNAVENPETPERGAEMIKESTSQDMVLFAALLAAYSASCVDKSEAVENPDKAAREAFLKLRGYPIVTITDNCDCPKCKEQRAKQKATVN